MTELINKLEKNGTLSFEEFVALIDGRNEKTTSLLRERAVAVRKEYYGNSVFIRGLIEFTNYCKNDCYYCGIRRSNKNANRYRLTKEEILSCCVEGYSLGFRTFVLQGGEDLYFTPDRISDIVKSIKKQYPDCAVTLSFGEHPKNVYKEWFLAGADRYLLRHETADSDHYGMLHPKEQTLESRMSCLETLKEIGYQTGCGFMVGSPFQKTEHIARDLFFISSFKPDMVGIGPFIPHKDTPFKNEPSGTLELTLFLISTIRLMLPNVLLPSTTALATLHNDGRKLGIMSGANVCMPNLSPPDVRDKYSLYNNKSSFGNEAAQNLIKLSEQMESIGYKTVISRGDKAERKM